MVYTKNIEKYCCRLETCSTIILSPRGQSGYYEGLHFNQADINKEGEERKISIIYPFYQYGCYKEYNPEDTQYYIPGSSIKGAIGSSDLGIDDMPVNYKDIKLRKLYKVQYASETEKVAENKKVKLEEFFKRLGIEMLNRKVYLSGDAFGRGEPELFLSKVRSDTAQKLFQLDKRLEEIIENNIIGTGEDVRIDTKSVLLKVRENIKEKMYKAQYLEKNSAFIFLGGYKGLLLSKVYGEADPLNGGIYIDIENNLPHGLAKISLERRSDD